jgi:hypothetical protein
VRVLRGGLRRGIGMGVVDGGGAALRRWRARCAESPPLDAAEVAAAAEVVLNRIGRERAAVRPGGRWVDPEGDAGRLDGLRAAWGVGPLSRVTAYGGVGAGRPVGQLGQRAHVKQRFRRAVSTSRRSSV